MFLHRGQKFFEKDITLRRKEEGVDLPIQCWTQIMDKDEEKYNFVIVWNCFGSRIRSLIFEPPRIPREIHEFLRPMEMRPDLSLSHNWEKLILYPNKTFFQGIWQWYGPICLTKGCTLEGRVPWNHEATRRFTNSVCTWYNKEMIILSRVDSVCWLYFLKGGMEEKGTSPRTL